MLRWESEQKRGQIVARRPDGRVVPVDEPGVQSVGGGNDEDVNGPQVAVQQRLRAAKFGQRLRALRYRVAQFVQPPQQPVAQCTLRRVGLPDFECVDCVEHVRFVKVNSKIAAVQTDFSQQRMARKTRVHSGDQLDRCPNLLAIRLVRIELVLAQVVIDLPDADATAIGDAAQQRRAAIVEADGREPAFRDQFIAPGNLRFEPLDHQAAGLVVDVEAQPEHA